MSSSRPFYSYFTFFVILFFLFLYFYFTFHSVSFFPIAYPDIPFTLSTPFFSTALTASAVVYIQLPLQLFTFNCQACFFIKSLLKPLSFTPTLLKLPFWYYSGWCHPPPTFFVFCICIVSFFGCRWRGEGKYLVL